MDKSEILQEFVINPDVTLSNRVIMGSMHLGWEEVPSGEFNLAAFYRRRAMGGVGLIITGGISPNPEGAIAKGAAFFNSNEQVSKHKIISGSVEGLGTKICLQILHAGRYAISPANVGASTLQAPINPYKPTKLSSEEVERTIEDFVKTAVLAEESGYHGVEIMGSEGYLLNQFSVTRTNKREDKWGGSIENRIRMSVEIVKRIRKHVNRKFLVIFRLSMLDLVDEGNSWQEIVKQAKAIEAAGADIINTGIGWHEARIPTIAGTVPDYGFLWVTERMKMEISIPIVATNRFNNLKDANEAILNQKADLISMARPFLADPDIVSNYAHGLSHKTNKCIACNQACLDHIFQSKPATCLVNPMAGKELYFSNKKTDVVKNIVVVGGGPAGMSFATYAAQAGHNVSLYEKRDKIGGQFNEAAMIPGKEIYKSTINYFKEQMQTLGVSIHLDRTFSVTEDLSTTTDILVWAAGITPRIPNIAGIEDEVVINYHDFLNSKEKRGKKIAIIGGGGISVDIALSILEDKDQDFFDFWGIDQELNSPGGLKLPIRNQSEIEVSLFMRSKGKIGKNLGKTTAWIHRLFLKYRGLKIVQGVKYISIENGELLYKMDGVKFKDKFDQIIVCAGQEPILFDSGEELPENIDFYSIGGANSAGELDAQKAIQEAFLLAHELST